VLVSAPLGDREPVVAASARDAEDRLRRIEAVTDVALSKLDLEDMLAELLDRIRDLLATDSAAVLLLEDSSPFLVAAAACGIEGEVAQGVRVPLGRGFAGRIAAERRPVILEQVNPTNVANPLLVRKGITSMLGVPLLSGENVLGVLHVGTLTARSFTDEDVALLELVADRVARAIAGRRALIDRAAAAALQRSLAPRRLPDLPGLDLAARYVPGSEFGVGGDWYDVFLLPSGLLGVAIGDVMGHGLRAATVMGRLRSALRAYALDDDDPARVLQRLDRKIQHFEPGQMSTVLYALLEPRRHLVRMSCAGHLAPALARPDAAAELIDVLVDLPLGVEPDVRRRTTALDLPPGALLCLFTDGLIEHRAGDVDVALIQLRDALAGEAIQTAETACAELMATLIGEREPHDDVSVLTLKRLAGTAVN
jgi:sigma-B regulation protein RsbU (phosphoserine phosphatase)